MEDEANILLLKFTDKHLDQNFSFEKNTFKFLDIF